MGLPRFVLCAIGINRMRQENADASQTDSHRYQLNHRTHRSRAYPTQHQGSPPILGCNAEKWFRRIRKAAELSPTLRQIGRGGLRSRARAAVATSNGGSLFLFYPSAAAAGR